MPHIAGLAGSCTESQRSAARRPWPQCICRQRAKRARGPPRRRGPWLFSPHPSPNRCRAVLITSARCKCFHRGENVTARARRFGAVRSWAPQPQRALLRCCVIFWHQSRTVCFSGACALAVWRSAQKQLAGRRAAGGAGAVRPARRRRVCSCKPVLQGGAGGLQPAAAAGILSNGAACLGRPARALASERCASHPGCAGGCSSVATTQRA